MARLTLLSWRRPAAVSTERILAERDCVRESWRAAATEMATLDSRYPVTAPGYFLDRYGFARLVRPNGHARTQPPRFGAADFDEREARLDKFMVPAVAIGGWVPVAREPTGVGSLYANLRSRWSRFVGEVGLPAGVGEITDATALTWRQVFDDSIFYPAGPAIPGATFVDTIDGVNRQRVLGTWGTAGIADFFCFMHQVHETLHKFQTGEPLLNEVVQAGVWVAFMDANPELWPFQVDSAGNSSAIRELALVRNLDWLVESAVAAGLDTATLVDARCAPGTYFLACLLGHRFDGRQINYNEYLRMVGAILAARWDSRRVLSVIQVLRAVGPTRRLQERDVKRVLRATSS
jgi:hypothetical protein